MVFKHKGLLLVIVLCCVTATWAVAAGTNRKAPEGSGIHATAKAATPGVIRAIGTITYDNNVPFQRSGQVDGMVGNRFNGLSDPHTLTSVTFRVAGNYGASVVMSVWDPGAGTASLLRRWVATGVPSGGGATASSVSVPVAQRTASGTVVSPILGHSGSLLVGIRNTWYTGFSCAPPSTGLNTTCDGIALTQGTSTIGNGVHGVQLPFAAGAVFVPTITTFSSAGSDLTQNAIMRATGENLPVELMSFGLAD